MYLHRVNLLAAISEKGTHKPLSLVFERTYHINDDFECPDQPQQFMRLAKSIFLNECERGLVDGIDLKSLGDYFVDATILDIVAIHPDQLSAFFNSNPDINVYNNW